MRYFGIFSLEMAPILDSATKYLAYIFFCIDVNPWLNNPIYGLQNRHSRSISSYFMAIFAFFWQNGGHLGFGHQIFDIQLFCCLCVNPWVNKPVFGHQNHHSMSISHYIMAFFQFSNELAAILDFAWLAALYGIAITFLAIFVFPDIKYIGIATISTRISLLLMKLKQKP